MKIEPKNVIIDHFSHEMASEPVIKIIFSVDGSRENIAVCELWDVETIDGLIRFLQFGKKELQRKMRSQSQLIQRSMPNDDPEEDDDC
jgi:hypothetical protein